MMTHRCPVCGAILDEPAWEGDFASYEICPCCGTQFGYTDSVPADQREGLHNQLRADWISAGCPWHSRSRTPPEGWDPQAQMASAGLDSRDLP